MKTTLAKLLALAFATFGQVAKVLALPETGVTSIVSQDHRFRAALTDNTAPASPWDTPYWLTITNSGRQIARYPFDGEFVSGYWSPGEKYLAVDNHCGHRGWYVWIISLSDDTVFTTTGRVPASGYNPYLKDEAMPDIDKLAKATLGKISPGIEDYGERNWPISIAYGWRSDSDLLMFHEVVSEQLAERDNAMMWLRSTYKLSGAGIKMVNLRGKKVKLNTPYPLAIDAVMNWIGR